MKAEITLTEKEFYRALVDYVGASPDAAIVEFYKWADGSVTFILTTDEHKVPPPPNSPSFHEAPPFPSLASASSISDDGASSISVEDEIPF